MMRVYQHRGMGEEAERALLGFHMQGAQDIASTELVEGVVRKMFPHAVEEVVFEKQEKKVLCLRCFMKISTEDPPYMQFQRKGGKRMWHIPFCEDPEDETQSVRWLCCVPIVEKDPSTN